MTSLERVTAAYLLLEPDRVPVFSMVSYGSGTPLGYSTWEYCHDVKKMVRSQLHFQERYGHDFVASFVDVWPFAEAVGVKLDFQENRNPEPIDYPVKSMEDLEKLEIPDPRRDGRLPILIQGIEMLRSETRGKVAVYTGGQGPFSLAAEIRGLATFLRDLYMNKELALGLIKFSTEYMIEMGRAEAQAGADIVHLGDSFAGPSLVSPTFFKDYAMPYDKLVFEQWKKEGVLTSLHICGKSTSIWDYMVETGTHNVEVDQTVNLAEAKRKVGARVCLTGNVDPSAVVYYGTTDEVERKSRECIDAAAEGGGYVLSPGCLVMPNFPAKNLEMLFKVAREYGRYPLRKRISPGGSTRHF
jgi:uroporphyrinogen decarboxylase